MTFLPVFITLQGSLCVSPNMLAMSSLTVPGPEIEALLYCCTGTLCELTAPSCLVSIIVEKTGSTSGTPWLVSVFVLFAVLGQDRINDNDNDNECHWAGCQLIGTTLENNSGSDDGQIEWHCDTPPLLITSYRAWEWADTPYDIVLNIKPGKAAGGIMAY